MAGDSEDASRDSLIEWFQVLKLIEASFDVIQLQGVRLKQRVHVADLAVPDVPSLLSGRLAQVMNQLQPTFRDLIQVNAVVIFAGVGQTRDRLPPVGPVAVVGDSGSLRPLATARVHLHQCSLQSARDQLSLSFGGRLQEVDEPLLAVVIEGTRRWILSKEGSQAGGDVLKALDNALGSTF